jgi:hypothetical protein
MDTRGRIIFLLTFIFIFVEIILINLFFISSFPWYSTPTGFSSSEGEISLVVGFSQAITVLRENFDGATTDFTVGGNSALETLVDMTLEHFGYGTIVFDEVVNLTEDAYSSTGTLYDRIVDIDSNLEISSNFISVNSDNLSSLNKSATITFYSLDYIAPKIIRNGVECPSSVCTLISNSGGTIIFTVSYFEHSSTTTYSLVDEIEEPYCGDDSCNGDETCSTCSEDCGTCHYCGDDSCNGDETCSTCSEDCGECDEGGGDSGGGTIGGRNVTNATGKYSFSLNPVEISADVEKGKAYPEQVIVTNTGTTDLRINVVPSSTISKFVKLDEKSFILKKGESRIYSFQVYSSTRIKADLYTGKLAFNSDKVKASLDLAISVQELPALFDMKLISTKEYVLPGRIASAEVRLANIGDAEYLDAVLEYGVMDFNNVIYVSKTENITVTRSILSKKISLKLPENLEMGRYLIYSKIIYKDKIAVSSDSFQIEQVSSIMWIIVLILIIILIGLVFFAIILIKKRRKEEELKKQPKPKTQQELKEEESETLDLVKDLLGELNRTKKKQSGINNFK